MITIGHGRTIKTIYTPLNDNFFNNKKVVLTGATGFIGSSLTKILINKGSRVYALARSDCNLWRIDQRTANQINWIYCDLCDLNSIKEHLQFIEPDFIYHLATYYSVDNKVDLQEIVDTNIKAGVLLLKACSDLNNLKLFINAGTCAEYGDLRKTANENCPVNPNTIYASTKTANTLIMHQLAPDLGVPLATLRLYNMFGEYENSSRIVPYIILSIIKNKEIILTGCEQSKDYSYLADIVDSFLKTAENYPKAKNEIFNIGSGRTITMKNLVDEIIMNFELKTNIAFGTLPYRENEMWYQGTSIKKAKKYLKWQPQISLSQGIKSTVDWYKNNYRLYENAK